MKLLLFYLQKNDFADKVIKLEKELEMVKEANAKLFKRIGDEVIDNSDDSILSNNDDEYSTNVNTRYHQLDAQFSGKYFYLTNVSDFVTYT